MCINGNSWVRCEKDGSVKMVDGSTEEYIRSCESGDVCPCGVLQRVSISDPCVLESDKDDSDLTCSLDGI